MVLKCDCKHEYQDRKYGKGMRVHTETKNGKTGPVVYRCTICLKERTA